MFILVLMFLSIFPFTLAAPLSSETPSTVSEGSPLILPDQSTVIVAQNAPVIVDEPATAVSANYLLDSDSGGPVIMRLKYLKADQAKSLISLVIPEDKIRVESVNNFLVLICSEFERQEINKILSEVDVPPLQVMFEAEAVEISRNDLKNIGIDWGSATSLPSSLTSSSGTLETSSFFRIGLGIRNHPEYGVNVQATINRLIENKKGKLLASPRIAALNGATAQILIGDKLAVESPSLNSNGVVTATTVTYIDVGIKLEVTPFVNDDGTITAHIKPEVSNKTDVTKYGNPNIRTRQAETTLRVKNGETIVLGGLIQRQETHDVFKVPLLGDIPLLGQFFRSTNTEKTETELIILITPKVIST